MAKPTKTTVLAKSSDGKCRFCKSLNTVVNGAPPDQCLQVCQDCKRDFHVCGAKTRSGGRCLKPAMSNGRCKLHGGMSTGRPLIHGRRSQFLPRRLAERVEAGLSDANLISVLEDVALVDALITEEAENLGEDKPAELWRQASKLVAAYDVGRNSEDPVTRALAMSAYSELKEILIQGNGLYERIGRILTMTEQKRKLSETEMKRLVHLKQFVSVVELAVMGARIQALILENVKDKKERERISAGLIELFRPDASGGNS